MNNLQNITIFCLLLTFCYSCTIAQSACSGYEYQIDRKKDIPANYTLQKQIRVDSKGRKNKKVRFSYVSVQAEKIHITLRDKCTEVKMRIEVLDQEKRIIATNFSDNNGLKDHLSFDSVKGVYTLQFSFKEHCTYCGVAILSKKSI